MTLDFTEATATHVQTKIIELELAIQLAKRECDALNAKIGELNEDLNDGDLIEYEKRSIRERISEIHGQVEKIEEKTETLKFQQRFYNKQLATGTIEIHEGLDY